MWELYKRNLLDALNNKVKYETSLKLQQAMIVIMIQVKERKKIVVIYIYRSVRLQALSSQIHCMYVYNITYSTIWTVGNF